MWIQENLTVCSAETETSTSLTVILEDQKDNIVANVMDTGCLWGLCRHCSSRFLSVIITVSFASSRPQHDTGNHVSPCIIGFRDRRLEGPY